jgi:transposase
VVRKGLGIRVHHCPACGLVLDRDTNVAINIKNRLGQSRRGGLNAPVEPRNSYLAVSGR